jgi:hypothetical protein
MAIIYNPYKKKGFFKIPAGGTKSPTPAPPSFSNTKSLAFDGVDDYVDLGSATTLNFTNDFTVSCWIKETGSLNRGIFNSGDRFGGQGWLLFRASTHKVSFKCAARTAISTTLINTGDWFHVVGTWEKNAALNPHGDTGSTGNRIRIYVNGTLEGTSTRISTNPPTYTGTIYNDIGTPYSGSNEFLGNIDEVSAFNSLLSPTQISDIYNSGSPTDLASLSPVAWYRNGDGATYPTIPDVGSGSNNGTMTNMSSGDIVSEVP